MLRKIVTVIVAMLMTICMALPVCAKETPTWSVEFDKNVPKEIVAAEQELLSAFPENIIDKLGNISTGLSVFVVNKLPKGAEDRRVYSMSPIIEDAEVVFINNTAYVHFDGSDTYLAHKLENFDKEAEKKWDEDYKAELERLYDKYQASNPVVDKNHSFTDSLKEFAENNALWIFFRCPNLSSIYLQLDK